MIDLDPGLLAAIIESPQDDLPRLLMADWLRERGDDARAEFIEVQIELANTKRCPYELLPTMINGIAQAVHGCRRCKAKRRELELLKNSIEGMQWLGSAFDKCLTPVVFTRGFVSGITITSAAWLQHAAAITKAAPIGRVTLTTYPTTSQLWGREAGDQIHRTDLTLAEFKERWPRIEFDFPGAGGVYRFPEGSTHRTVYVGPSGEPVE